jgi:Mitochondrial carrier protein
MQVEVSRYGSYRNISSSLRAVFKNEGLRGFYQGMTPAIIGACGSWGGYFYFYEMAKKRRMANLTVGETKLKTADHVRFHRLPSIRGKF